MKRLTHLTSQHVRQCQEKRRRLKIPLLTRLPVTQTQHENALDEPPVDRVVSIVRDVAHDESSAGKVEEGFGFRVVLKVCIVGGGAEGEDGEEEGELVQSEGGWLCVKVEEEEAEGEEFCVQEDLVLQKV